MVSLLVPVDLVSIRSLLSGKRDYDLYRVKFDAVPVSEYCWRLNPTNEGTVLTL